MLGHGDVLVLHDRDTGEAAGRFTTIGVRVQERTALENGAAVAGAGRHQGVKARHQEEALASRSLREDQRAAFEHAVSDGGLKLIEGRAGTGKSFTRSPPCVRRTSWPAIVSSAWHPPMPSPRT